jgi:hypothetical protein
MQAVMRAQWEAMKRKKRREKAAVIIQCACRSAIARHKSTELLKGIFICFKSVEGHVPYWFNPRTR